MNRFQSSLDNLQILVDRLENSEIVSDQQLLSACHEFAALMQTNCDSAAQGFFVIAADVCFHRPKLSAEFLKYAMQSLYYLGYEELDDIKRYIRELLNTENLYLGHLSSNGREYLVRLLEQNATIIKAFRLMYAMEDNDWRKEDPDYPDIPPILC